MEAILHRYQDHPEYGPYYRVYGSWKLYLPNAITQVGPISSKPWSWTESYSVALDRDNNEPYHYMALFRYKGFSERYQKLLIYQRLVDCFI